MATDRRWLAAVMAIGFLLRLGWGIYLPADEATIEKLPDQAGYLGLARSLLEGKGLVWVDPHYHDETYATRTPGYPAFVALCGANVRVVRAVQAMIDATTILAAWILARRWLSERVAMVAAGLVAFNPFMIYFSALVLTETVFTAVLCWSMVLLTGPASFVWGGAVLALSILIRPSGIGLPVLLGIGSVLANHRMYADQRRRWPLPVGMTMVMLTALVLAPWAWRNYHVLGEWVVTTTNDGFAAFEGFNEEATGASDRSPLSSPEWRARMRGMNEVERNRFLAQQGKAWAAQTWRERPGRLVRLTAAKVARTWSPIPLSAEFGSRWHYRIIAAAYSIPLCVLTVVGLWWFTGIPRAAKVLLLLPAVYFTILHATSIGSLRYRIPVEPLLAVLAAGGAAVVVRRVEEEKAEEAMSDQ